MMRPRHLAIPVPGGDLAVSIEGPVTNRAPLLLIHGWALDQRVWAPQIAAFAAERQVVTFDRRGFGQSTAPADPTQEADDLGTIITTLDLMPPILIGMSQGARSVASFIAQHADAVSGAVFHGAPPGPGDDEGSFTAPSALVRSLAGAGRYGDIARLLADHPLFRLPGGGGRTALDDILADYRARDADVAQPRQDWSESLPSAVPMLFLYGERDSPARIAIGRRLQRRYGNARLAIVDGAGHLASLCSATAFNAVLASFFASVEPRQFHTVALPVRR